MGVPIWEVQNRAGASDWVGEGTSEWDTQYLDSNTSSSEGIHPGFETHGWHH